MSIKHIRVCSDLHLEGFYGRNPEMLLIDFVPSDERDKESILVLAGDISSVPDQLVAFLQCALQKFPQVLFIPGNHEYYRHDCGAWNQEMAERLHKYCPGLHFALGTVKNVQLDDTRFIFGTLWGDGGPGLADQAQVGYFLNDFRLIRFEGRRFTVQDMMNIHQTQKAEIRRSLEIPFDGKTVVVTHHLPSRRLVSARFWPGDGSDGANGGFASCCDGMIAALEPDLWIHGHTHDTIDTTLWKTRIVCNPAGYRGEWQTSFNSFMTAVDGAIVTVPKFIEL